MVARALRDAGMEVVYTGLHQTPEQIVEAAIQEDADAVGLSVLSGAHMTLFAKVAALLEGRDAKDIVVFGGGIIPEADIAELEKARCRQGVHSRRDDDRDRRVGPHPRHPELSRRPSSETGWLRDGLDGQRVMAMTTPERSQRITDNSADVGSETHPEVECPWSTCRKIADPAPAVRASL